MQHIRQVVGQNGGSAQLCRENGTKFCSNQFASCPTQVVAQPADGGYHGQELSALDTKPVSHLFWRHSLMDVLVNKDYTHPQTFANTLNMFAKACRTFFLLIRPIV